MYALRVLLGVFDCNYTSFTIISTVCLVIGLTVTTATGSSVVNSGLQSQLSTMLSPLY
ncbi:hypothetical protein HanHA89_Chr13g0508541 [Helianthus annuus]|nr:hypothetical protein HanHA89_Chr13g0508541 [Helianthus annuus]